MKKIYLLGFALCAFAFTGTAQVELTDDFESYSLGDISPQSSHWRTWSGALAGEEEAQVTNILSNSGAQSLTLGPGEPEGPQDMILLVPSAPNSGIYTIQWQMYIPTGQSGYFNMQGALTAPGTPWEQALNGGNVYFNCDGASGGSGRVSGGIDCEPLPDDAEFSYPEDEWFTVSAIYNLDDQVWAMNINGTEQFNSYTFTFGEDPFVELAGLDFFAANESNTFYMDDFVLAEGELGVDNFSADIFSVYPNPVKDVLNIESAAAVNAVTVYDVLGKTVLSAQPDAISPKVDMSGLSSGAYLVQVTIDGASKTVKVIK